MKKLLISVLFILLMTVAARASVDGLLESPGILSNKLFSGHLLSNSPAAGLTTCSNSLDFSQSCNSQYLAVF